MLGFSTAEFWYVFGGFLLISFGVLRRFSARSPVTPAMLYFGLGLLCSPLVLNRIDLHHRDAHVLEALSEFIVIISVFSAALKLKIRRGDRRVGLILRLAALAMVITIVTAAALGHLLLGLSVPAALLLAAILAPTDPVLASSVQVDHKDDRDAVRQALTGEAGVNDSTAFPFIYLAMALLGLRELGPYGLSWAWNDLVYGIGFAGFIGFSCGAAAAKGIGKAREKGFETEVLDDFVAVGLMALSYGLGLFAHAYGFVAVFVAGLTFRILIDRMRIKRDTDNVGEMIRFHDQVERFGEVMGVLVLGSLAGSITFRPLSLAFAAGLFFLIRPLATYLSLLGTGVSRAQRGLIAWLGIRGIGSIYYLAYVTSHGLNAALGKQLTEIVVPVLAASIFLHGATSNYLMNRYRERAPASG